jgi:hypothetical protein
MHEAPNFGSEQVDRIRSVAQLRSSQASEVLHEPPQPDMASSFQASFLALRLHLGIALVCL